MKIIVDDQLIEYSDQGSGRVVVLMHGWGVDSDNLRSLAGQLASDFRVISFDFPGFGKSIIPTSAWHVGDYAECAGKLFKKLDIEPYAVLGHSFGGRIIIKGLSNEFFASNKVVLMGSAGIKPAKDLKKQLLKAVVKTGKVIVKLPVLNRFESKLRNRLYERIGNTDYLKSGRLKQIFLNTINEDLLPLISKIKQPTLLVWGEEDAETPISDAEKMQSVLPDAELFKVSGAGHFVHLDEPNLVYEKIREFLL